MNDGDQHEVVVITGASAGVGRATARAFGLRRASVGLLARGREGLEATRREIEDAGGRALVLPTDVANADQVEAAAASVEAAFGPITVWVNSAMVSVFSPVEQMEPDEFRRVIEVTCLGTVFGTMAALRRMLPCDRGVIVQVGSALAYRSIPLQSAYCAAKQAVLGFTASLRSELMHQHSRVRVTMVHLPALNTPQFGWAKSRLPRKAQPPPPIYQPELAARAILWAAEHQPPEVEVGLATSLILKANSLAPGLGDWCLGLSEYESQMTDEPEDPQRPSNLWEPVPGDHGAQGDFGNRAHRAAGQFWSLPRGTLALGAGLAAVGLAAWLLRRHR